MTIRKATSMPGGPRRGVPAALPERAHDAGSDCAAADDLRTPPPRDECDAAPELHTLLDLRELIEDNAGTVASMLRSMAIRIRIRKNDAGWLFAVSWILDQMPKIRSVAQRDEYHRRLEQLIRLDGNRARARFARTIGGLLLVPLVLRIMDWDRQHG